MRIFIIFISGYYGFFMLEPYSTSARFVLRGHETGLGVAFQNGITALGQYVSGFDSISNIILRVAYLIVLGYGLKELFCIFFKPKNCNIPLKATELFGLLTIINFILVTTAGLFSGGTVFLDIPQIGHYYELSAI